MAAQTVPDNAEKKTVSDIYQIVLNNNRKKTKTKKTEKGCPINRPINRCNIGCVCCLLAYI